MIFLLDLTSKILLDFFTGDYSITFYQYIFTGKSTSKVLLEKHTIKVFIRCFSIFRSVAVLVWVKDQNLAHLV